jgi:hypothetical protein
MPAVGLYVKAAAPPAAGPRLARTASYPGACLRTRAICAQEGSSPIGRHVVLPTRERPGPLWAAIWPRPLAPSAGPVRWPRPLAKSAAEIIGKTWRCAPCQGVFCNCDAELTGPVGQPLAQPRIAAYSVGSVPIREMINAGLTALHSRFGNRKHAWQCGTMRRRRARAGRRRFYHSSLQDPGRSIINPLVRRRSG